jgi:hypothetical protein
MRRKLDEAALFGDLAWVNTQERKLVHQLRETRRRARASLAGTLDLSL